MNLSTKLSRVALVLSLLAGGGCGKLVPPGALVVTQVPTPGPGVPAAKDMLDARYPPGSRVVLVIPPYRPLDVRVLSQGLEAAGDPVVSPDGRCVFFAGKAHGADAWQIYAAKVSGGQPKAVTSMDGGAMGAAIIATGDLVFGSPVPNVGETWNTSRPSALYSQSPNGKPRRLTYGPMSALDPTALADGRILFVSGQPNATTGSTPHLALFTVNNDGTEVTAFAGKHDRVAFVRRPRDLLDGHVGFLASNADALGDSWAEGVSLARPFANRGPLFSFPGARCRSVEPGGDGTILVSLESRGVSGRSMRGSQAVFRLVAGAQTLPQPLFDDPAWDDIEATRVAARPKPMGHVTAIAPGKNYGTILCLDANRSTYQTAQNGNRSATARIRVLNQVGNGKVRVLGEVPVQTDGSFMAEVPADIPLGFEALDEQGQVLRRLPPMIWVRAGENRSCIGCHEPHNHSPRNARPLAASQPPVVLGGQTGCVAIHPPAP